MSSWKDNIRRVEPYTPGEQPRGENIIKLNTNENPYPPSPKVMEALRSIDGGSMRLYPDPEAGILRDALAEEYGVGAEQVFVGVGSDDVLSTIFLTCFNGPLPVLFPDVTYSFYPVWAACYGVPYETVPLTAQWKVDPSDYGRENGGIIIANPNAPTGIAMPVSDVRRILEMNPASVVVIDEAYVDFGAESALPLIAEYENLIVVQTFSKSRSMAGMRIGFAFGSGQIIKCLYDVRYSVNSYTINLPSLAAGSAALADRDHFEETKKKIVETREDARRVLESLGFTCLDSSANFLFVTHPVKKAADLYGQLRERGIYVRYFALPRIDNYLRITIGTPEQMKALTDALAELTDRER